jgi:SHS2 domain-containing protein
MPLPDRERSMTVDSGYSLLEHTADAGVRAWGRDPADAFASAARGMFAIMLGDDPADLRAAARPMAREVAVTGESWDDLLVNWLAELLFQFEVDRFVPQHMRFEACAPPRCAATVEGICIDDLDAIAGVGIKAVTYHQMDVQITPGRTTVQVIFDI